MLVIFYSEAHSIVDVIFNRIFRIECFFWFSTPALVEHTIPRLAVFVFLAGYFIDVVILRIHLPQRVVAWTRFIVVNLVSEFLSRFFANVSGKFIDIRVNFLFDDLMTVRVVCRKFIGVGVVLHPANVMTQVVPFGLLVASGPRQAVVALFSGFAQPSKGALADTSTSLRLSLTIVTLNSESC